MVMKDKTTGLISIGFGIGLCFAALVFISFLMVYVDLASTEDKIAAINVGENNFISWQDNVKCEDPDTCESTDELKGIDTGTEFTSDMDKPMISENIVRTGGSDNDRKGS